MAINYVPGRGWVNTDGGYVLGGAVDTAMRDSYQREKAEFLQNHGYNPDNEYDYRSLFGSISDEATYTPSFNDGPNSSWTAALTDRLNLREYGTYAGQGHFEHRLMTTDRDYAGRVFDRNNQIEEMFRRGYSRAQIHDYLAGNADPSNFTPDWSDYHSMRRESLGSDTGPQDAAGLLSGTIDLGSDDEAFWGDDYFIGIPDKRYADNPFDTGNSPTPQDPTGNPSAPTIPSSKPEGGFMGAYNARREELDNKPSVMSLFDEMKNYEQS